MILSIICVCGNDSTYPYSPITGTIDGSDHAAKATDITAALAKAVGSEVLVLHVLERIAASKGAPATDLEMPRDAAGLAEEAATRLISAGIQPTGKVVTAPSGRVVAEAL